MYCRCPGRIRNPDIRSDLPVCSTLAESLSGDPMGEYRFVRPASNPEVPRQLKNLF